MSTTSDPARQLLRHTVATAAYRGGKALRGAPESFAAFTIGDSPRTPAKILAHIGDLFDWALSMARGETAWHNSEPLAWDAEVARFHASLKKFDDYLACLGTPSRTRRRPVPGSHRRRPDAHWPDRHASPPRRSAPSKARITSKPKSLLAASAPSKLPRAASSTDANGNSLAAQQRVCAKGFHRAAAASASASGNLETTAVPPDQLRRLPTALWSLRT